MGLRNRSIRVRVFLLVIIPVLALIGVYTFAVGISAGDAIRLARATRVTALIRLPNSQVQNQLDAESLLALTYLGTPTSINLSALDHQQVSTDRAVRQYLATVRSTAVTSNASAAEERTITAGINSLATLPAIRAGIAARSVSGLSAVAFYSNLVIEGFRVYDGSIDQATSVPLVTQGLDLTKLGEVDQTVLDETELLTSSLAARSFPAADRAEFTELAGTRRFLLAQTLPGLRAPYSGFYAKYVSPRAAADLTSLEDAVIGGPQVDGLPTVPPLAWNTAAGGYALGLAAALEKSGNAIAAQAQAEADATYRRLALIGGLGLLAIVAAIVISLVTGRRIIGQLAELRRSALELANDRLPSVMRRLRSGEDVNIAAEVLSLEPGSDEIGQVRQAFDLVQRAAIEAAADEARLRHGVSDVFRNLARRSQALLHRQLTLLDDLERRADGPEELENLFRIDHLTTRMRRQAESLIVLSGELPGRGWRYPVPLVDVVRAAAAEVEDYARIRVVVRTKAALAGAAVADVIHLVAELAENAATFSPPNTPVQILGDVVGRGFAIEIEDRGFGLADERLAEINRDFASPPEFDLSGSDRIGLFIAGQLAQRHKIKIHLRNSPFGGIAVIILIPQDLVVAEGAYENDLSVAGNGASGVHGGNGVRLTGRHASLSQGSDNGAGPPGISSHPPATGTSPRDSGRSGQPPAPSDPSDPSDQPVTDWLPAPPRIAVDRLVDPRPSTGESTPTEPFSAFGPAPANPQRHTPVEPTGQVASADPDELDLPVRVRQASLAPQLRAEAEASPAPDASQAAASPEAARQTMAAMQRGWERGRAASGSEEQRSGAVSDAESTSSDGLDNGHR